MLQCLCSLLAKIASLKKKKPLPVPHHGELKLKFPSIALVTLQWRAWCQSVYPDDIIVFVEASHLKSFIVGVFSTLQTLIMWQWLHTTASVLECIRCVSIHPAGYFQKITFWRRTEENFRCAAFIMCHECWEALTRWWRVSCLSSSCLSFCHRVKKIRARLQLCNYSRAVKVNAIMTR